MSDYLRNLFGLTQERLASWLGVKRSTLAAAETGRRSLPIGHGVQEARLSLASLGKVLNLDDPHAPLPELPALAPPAADLDALSWRLTECRHQARQLRRKLSTLQAQAAQCQARLAALPALRAYTGPVANPAREAGWLALFEGEAVDALRDTCGPGPQRLLEARIAGLEREAELLAEMLGPLAPLPPSF